MWRPWQDLRYAFRQLRKSPGFTLVAVLTLALGIGPNVAMFTVIYGIYLAPVPYPNADQMVAVWTKINDQRIPSAADDYLQYASQSKSFQYLCFLSWSPATLTDGDPSEEPVVGNPVTPGFFSKYFERRMYMGRDFLPEEATIGRDHVMTIGYRLWKEHFHGDPGILGKQVSVNGQPYTVVGVEPPGHSDRQKPNFRVPVVLNPAGHNPQYGDIFGRLKPGVTIAEAQAELDVINRRLSTTHPTGDNNRWSVSVESTRNAWLDKSVARNLWLLLAAVSFVLLIACVNVANLLLGRGKVRTREIAVRSAIGASRRHVFVQLLTESLVLASLGCLVGIGLAWALVKLVVALDPGMLQQVTEAVFEINTPVLLFAVGLTTVAAILFGCAPAWRASHLNLTETLNEGAQSIMGGRRARAQALLVITEFALAITLLSGAGMAMHSFWKLATVDLGFNPDHILTTGVGVADLKNGNVQQVATNARQVLDQLRAIPGVQDVALTTGLPLSGAATFPFELAGHPADENVRTVADLESVTPSFFSTFRIQVVRGRLFAETDTSGSTPVAVVNEAFVRRFLAGTDPLSHRLVISQLIPSPKIPGALIDGAKVERQIVGVFRDVRNNPKITDEAMPEICVPYWQMPWPYVGVGVRTALNSGQMTQSVRAELVTSGHNPSRIEVLQQTIDAQLKGQRFGMVLFACFAGLALLLATVGIYGVMAFAVTQRRHEIGLRIALGANPEQVQRMVLRDGLSLSLVGLTIGFAGVAILGKLMRSTLYGVDAFDVPSVLLVALVLIVAAVVASYIPAHRASAVDPMVALRYE